MRPTNPTHSSALKPILREKKFHGTNEAYIRKKEMKGKK
jgi:hypothetical protein